MTTTRSEGRRVAAPRRASPRPPYRRALVIANPVSGRCRGAKAARELEEGLSRLGVPTSVFLTGARGDAFTRLRSLEPDVDLVVAVGGDGTIREVFHGLVDPEVPVAVLPLGTANVLATGLGLPRDVHHALEIFAGRRVAPIDVATVNGETSFLVVGVGLDAMAVREVERRRRGPISKWTYLDAVLRVLRRYEPPRLRVEVDGEEVPGEHGLVIVSNAVGYGGMLSLAADARIDDGQLEVYLFPTGRTLELVAAFVRGVLRRWPSGPIRMRRGRRIRITSDRPVPFQVDGDLGGVTPVEVELSPVQYHVLVP